MTGKLRWYLMTLGTFLLLLSIVYSCGPSRKTAISIEGEQFRLDFTGALHSRIAAKIDGRYTALGGFSPSECITVAGTEIADFHLAESRTEQINDDLGSGRRHIIVGNASTAALSKTISVTVYEELPEMVITEVMYQNTGDSALAVDSLTNNRYYLKSTASVTDEPPFWSYQSGSYEHRPDWIVPLEEGFSQRNYMGMNATDYGGGTPVSDVWRKDVGLAVGHIETVPKLVSLPVNMPDGKKAVLAVNYDRSTTLEPGESLTTLKTFVAVHRGDHFTTLRAYRRVMERQGIVFREAPEDAYRSIWCGWGYGRGVTLEQMYGTLPMVEKLGLGWVTFDDGWQLGDGDWYLQPGKFPRGDRDMRAFVDEVHSRGLKANLWWAPLAVHLGTDLIHEFPEYVLLNRDGSMQFISYWRDYYLCPAYEEVVENAKALVRKFMIDWDFDGLKIDGQHLNGVPPCYNRDHNHEYPEESVEQLPAYLKAIYDQALAIKPDAVIEICPCGCAYSFFL